MRYSMQAKALPEHETHRVSKSQNIGRCVEDGFERMREGILASPMLRIGFLLKTPSRIHVAQGQERRLNRENGNMRVADIGCMRNVPLCRRLCRRLCRF